MEITKGKIGGAIKCCLYGPEGIGKSSLAAMFPNSVFIDTEGSTKYMDVARTPAPSSWTMLLEQVKYFKQNPSMCDSLVIDTADWTEQLCISHICSTYNKTGIEDFGYGKGYVYLEEEFGRLLNALSDLIGAGINVVMTAHAYMRKFEQPDEMGAYDRWEFKLEKKTAPLVKEWADMVLFVNYKTWAVSTGDNGKGPKKAQGGKRVIYTQHHPCWDAKNRHGLPEELSFNSPEDGWKQIAHCIPPRVNKPVSRSAESEPMAMNLDEMEPAVKTIERPNSNEDFISTAMEAAKKSSQKTVSKESERRSELDNLPRPLADLMLGNNVTIEEIQKAVASRGYYPIDTPITNYESGFIDGVLIAAWPQVFKMICDNR
jgi:hypothetical protein